MDQPRILNTRTTHADPAALTLHPENPRRGDVNEVAASFEVNGFWGTVCVDERTGYVLVGNHRVMAARQLGWPEIPVTYVRTEGDEHALRILLADNRTSDLGTYDAEGLALLLDSLASTDAGLRGTGYTDDYMDDLRASLPESANGGATMGAGGKLPEDMIAGFLSANIKQIVLALPAEDYEPTLDRLAAVMDAEGLESNTAAVLHCLACYEAENAHA